MNKDRAIGAAILAGSVVGIVVYAWLVYAFPVMILQITAFVTVTLSVGPSLALVSLGGLLLSVRRGESDLRRL